MIPPADFDAALVDGARALGLALDPAQVLAFGRYREEILRWRRAVNLTGFRTGAEVVTRGFLGSLAYLLGVPAAPNLQAIDIGSGAGFPGLPVKIARPDLAVTLVESNRRRVSFLRHVIRALGLQGLRVEHLRAEALAARPAEAGAYDIAFARAVSDLPGQVRLASPFLAAGGRLVAYRARGAVAEAAELAAATAFRVHPPTPVPRLGPDPPGFVVVVERVL